MRAQTAAIVGVMCQLVAEEVRAGNAKVLADARRVVGDGCDCGDPKALANCILHTAYMGTVNRFTLGPFRIRCAPIDASGWGIP